MLFNFYFRIEAKTELKTFLDQLTEDEGIKLLLCAPVLWIATIPGLSRWTIDMHATQIKLLFLVNLSYLYLGEINAESDMQPIVWSLLGQPPVHVEKFDEWWTIEYYDDSQGTGEVEDVASLEDVEMLAETGVGVVDDWLKYLIQKKKDTSKR